MKVYCGWRAVLAIAILSGAAAVHGQVVQSAEGHGQSLRLGVDFSNLQAGFPIASNLRLSGVGVFWEFQLDAQVWSRGPYPLSQLQKLERRDRTGLSCRAAPHVSA